MSQASFKVVFLGESGCGKTSLIARYVDKTFTSTLTPTVGCAGRLVTYEYLGRELTLLLWDTAGQELYRSLTPVYYRNSAAAVIVFDVTSKATFEQVPGWISELQSVVGDIVMVVCGNKCDLESDRVIEELEAAALANGSNARYAETSAKTGQGLDQLFQVIVKEVMERRREAIDDHQPIQATTRNRRECC